MLPLSGGGDIAVGHSPYVANARQQFDNSTPLHFLDLSSRSGNTSPSGLYHISPIVPTPAPARHSGLISGEPIGPGASDARELYPSMTCTLPSQRTNKIRLGTTALAGRPDSAGSRRQRSNWQRGANREYPANQAGFRPVRRDEHPMQCYFEGSDPSRSSAARASYPYYSDDPDFSELQQQSRSRRPRVDVGDRGTQNTTIGAQWQMSDIPIGPNFGRPQLTQKTRSGITRPSEICDPLLLQDLLDRQNPSRDRRQDHHLDADDD